MNAIATFATRTQDDGAAILLDRSASDGRAQVIEVIGHPGMKPVEAGIADAHYAYVVAGTWTIAVGEEERACAPDTTVFAPVGFSLRYAVTGETAGTLLLITMPV